MKILSTLLIGTLLFINPAPNEWSLAKEKMVSRFTPA